MENVTRETLIKYGNRLASKVLSGELSAATAQNYVSAANRVMGIARGDNDVSVSPTISIYTTFPKNCWAVAFKPSNSS